MPLINVNVIDNTISTNRELLHFLNIHRLKLFIDVEQEERRFLNRKSKYTVYIKTDNNNEVVSCITFPCDISEASLVIGRGHNLKQVISKLIVSNNNKILYELASRSRLDNMKDEDRFKSIGTFYVETFDYKRIELNVWGELYSGRMKNKRKSFTKVKIG